MRTVGIAVWNFADGTIGSRTRAFAEMGYTSASVLGSFVSDTPDDELAEFDEVVADKDIRVTVHSGAFKHLRETGEMSQVVAEAESVVAWHSRTGRVACLTYDMPFNAEIREGVWRKTPDPAVPALLEVLRITQGTGIRVGFEDCPMDTETMARFGDRVPEFAHWGVLVDLGHMNMRLRGPRHDPQPLDKDGFAKAIEAIPIDIIELHIHSNDGTKDQHAPPYTGNADIRGAAAALKRIGFAGISTIELVPAWCGIPNDKAMEAAAESLAYWLSLSSESQEAL